MTGYLIYVRDVFVGQSDGRDRQHAIQRHIEGCGFDSLEEYAAECLADTADIQARRVGRDCRPRHG